MVKAIVMLPMNAKQTLFVTLLIAALIILDLPLMWIAVPVVYLDVSFIKLNQNRKCFLLVKLF